MTNTKAKWFRDPGSKPVNEPRRPGREYPRTPDERRNYPTPRDPTPRRPPGVPVPSHNDPRFRPGGPYGPKVKPEIPPVRGPRPVSPRPFPAHGPVRLPNPRPFRFPKLPTPFGNPLWDIIPAAVEEIIYPDPNLDRVPALPHNYRWCNGPGDFNWFKMPGFRKFESYGGPFFANNGSCFVGAIDSQSPAAWDGRMGMGILNGNLRCYWWWNYDFVPWPGDFRGATVGSVERVGPAINPQPGPHPPLIPLRWSNPNIERWAPYFPDEFPEIAPPVEDLEPGVAEPPTVKNPDSPYDPDHAWAWDPVFGLAPVVFAPPVSNTPPEVPVPPTVRLPPSQREAPPAGTRQRKAMARTKAVAIAIYKALDWASEAAEVVDAIYQALPKKVRDRWEKDRGAHWVRDYVTGKWKKVGLDRPGDQFGQYGLEGADWKLQAIYHNLGSLDLELAFRNIVKNHLSDLVIGGMQKKLPNNTGNAHAEGEREVAKWLDDIFTGELGL